MHIKANDTVEVITGEEKGTRGRVLRINREAGMITVEGVNKVHKHVRRSQKNPQGGRLSKEQPIALSNVLMVCSKCNKPSRTGARILPDKNKERFCKNCGSGLGEISVNKKKKKAGQQA